MFSHFASAAIGARAIPEHVRLTSVQVLEAWLFLDFGCDLKIHEVWLAVGGGRNENRRRGPGGEPHLEAPQGPLKAGVLSASHGDWLASPGPAANHGCYHGAGRDPIAIPPSIFGCLLRYYPIVRASSLFDFAQWASRVESSHGGCSRPAGCFETGGAPEDRGLDELNIIHSGRQRSLRLTSRKIVTDTIIMRLRCAVPIQTRICQHRQQPWHLE